MNYIKNFNQITINDIPSVGGKNASLGEMIRELSSAGITVPDGFAITAQAYWHFLEQNKFEDKLRAILAQVTNPEDFATLQKAGKQARELIKSGTIPADLIAEITQGYQDLSKKYNQSFDGAQDRSNLAVAVRSSATAEDLPTASFAGQQETFLNVTGVEELLRAYVDCLASLFTDRAIVYRIDNHFDHFKVGISVGIQKMIRSDLGSSGVAFSLDTETGFPNVVTIDASWGLGESIVQGSVTPDEFVVHKQTLRQSSQASHKASPDAAGRTDKGSTCPSINSGRTEEELSSASIDFSNSDFFSGNTSVFSGISGFFSNRSAEALPRFRGID